MTTTSFLPASMSVIVRCSAGRATLPPEKAVFVDYRHPAFRALAGDVGVTGVALHVDRVVFLIQALASARLYSNFERQEVRRGIGLR